MFKKAAVFVLVLVLARPAGAADTDIVNMSYLELLELDKYPAFSGEQIEGIKKQLDAEKESEQKRLKQEEEKFGQQAKQVRERLKHLGKSSSRDTPQLAEERKVLQCRILDMESQERKTKTARDHGVPVSYQNKLAKLELIQRWPALREEIERHIEAGQARQRRFGNVEDIGVRDLLIEDLPEKQAKDVKLGQDAVKEMSAQGLMPPAVADPELTGYMQKLGQRIAVNSDLHVPIKVTVLNSEEINAFALPGGFLYVNSGLVNKAETESELAGVMAHEIAHDAARHGARLTKKANLANIFYQAAQIGASLFLGPLSTFGYYALQYGFFGLGMILDLSILGVSRDYESEADQLGAQYAWKAGYDPKGFITFFDKMASEEGYVRSASFFRTHPPYLERILSTFSEISYLPPKRELQMTSSEFLDAKSRIQDVLEERKEEERNKPSLRGPVQDCEDVLGHPIS